MKLTVSRARDLMRRFADRRVLVVGDLMLDRYVSGRVERISPEAPVPILHVTGERSVPGGACNVALNIQALGGISRVCGVVGTDADAEELLGHLHRAGVDTGSVHREARVSTVVKTRFVSDRQQMLRVDREDHDAILETDARELEAALDRGLNGVRGVILEDYGKGMLRQEVVGRALASCRDAGIPCGYDPKDNHDLDVRGITFATPNRKEAFTVAGVRDSTPGVAPSADSHLLEAANRLFERWEPEHLLITLGPQGMWLNEGRHHNQHLPTRAREVFDVSGAGDTVIATSLLALAAGAGFVEAAELANVAAGLVVAKPGTATTTPEEILAALEAGE